MQNTSVFDDSSAFRIFLRNIISEYNNQLQHEGSEPGLFAVLLQRYKSMVNHQVDRGGGGSTFREFLRMTKCMNIYVYI